MQANKTCPNIANDKIQSNLAVMMFYFLYLLKIKMKINFAIFHYFERINWHGHLKIESNYAHAAMNAS